MGVLNATNEVKMLFDEDREIMHSAKQQGWSSDITPDVIKQFHEGIDSWLSFVKQINNSARETILKFIKHVELKDI